MLNEEQASQIVVDCIRAESHVPVVDFNGSLDDAGIIDTPRVNNVITRIVNSNSIGVPSQQHRINPVFLQGIDTDTIVDDVVGIVRDKSTPVLANAAPTKKAGKSSIKGAGKKGAKGAKGAKGQGEKTNK